jgi:hypothetical protein
VIFKNAVFCDVTPRGDVSEELNTSVIKVTRIGELVTRATRRNIQEDGVLQSHRCEKKERKKGRKVERNRPTNSVVLSPQANYTDRRPPLVGEFNASFCG